MILSLFNCHRTSIMMSETPQFNDEFKHVDAEIFYNSKLFSLDETEVEVIVDMLKEIGKMDRNNKSETLLDVGCGLGFATSLMAKHFDHTIGVDASAHQIEKVREMNRSGNIEFKVGTAENLPVADNSVDVIISIFSLQIFDVTRFPTECRRVLKPGGVAIFYTDYISTVMSLDDTQLPPISDVIMDTRKKCFMIADALSHPDRHILDLNQSLYNAIKWIGKRRILQQYEIASNLGAIRNMYLSVPFYAKLGTTKENPMVKMFKDVKEMWEMKDAKDENVRILATYDVSMIVLRK